MEASKVEVREELIKFKPISNKAKNALRKQRIKDLIERRPYMSRINSLDMAEAAQLSPAGAWAMALRMVQQGEIVKHNLSAKTYAFTLNPPVTVTAPATVNRPAEASKAAEAAPTGPESTTQATLVQYAKDFAWKTGSDSLREFVAYMDGKELELRRLAD